MVDLVNRAFRGLNRLSGCKGAAASPSLGAPVLDKHASLQRHLFREALRRQAAAPQVMPKAEVALGGAAPGHSACETDSAPRDLVSYQPGKFSLPDSIHECRFIEDVAGFAGRPFLEEN